MVLYLVSLPKFIIKFDDIIQAYRVLCSLSNDIVQNGACLKLFFFPYKAIFMRLGPMLRYFSGH